MAGIRLVNCDDIEMVGNIIIGYDVGMELSKCSKIKINKNNYVDVRVAVKADEIDDLESIGNVQNESKDFKEALTMDENINPLPNPHQKGFYQNLLSSEALNFCIKKLRENKNGNV